LCLSRASLGKKIGFMSFLFVKKAQKGYIHMYIFICIYCSRRTSIRLSLAQS
jgi:hypothetical protein